ncbi:serine/threonine-protein kinase-like protein CCR4 [Phoenix dactylifera]|uniref:Serine/threonine-protein kinase-like protein CCR4 n=1 Tax=Phoenix dactylifera TaxID=42345 RepID=A0A8B7MVY1_PHODC|nr:serine/threonine-protein kinase-like protein CCR4 [Phoenix dactylifera]
MSPSRTSPCLFLLLVFLSFSIPSTFSSPLSTISISHFSNVTLVCALVQSSPTNFFDLNCTALPYRTQRSYPSGAVPYAAVAAGDDFLCALTSPPDNSNATMRWWHFAIHGSDPGKRIYRGPSLVALAAGDSRVCGLIGDARKPTCWRWPEVSFPAGLSFTDIAVGRDFVCGLSNYGSIKCFGNDSDIVGREHPGNFSSVAAGSRHACGITTDGKLSCWGAGAPKVPDFPTGIVSMALGANRTCVLRANGTVLCWGDNPQLPCDIAAEEFITIEAKGDAVCGILTANFSVVCWGSEIFRQNHVVYDRAKPGTCVPTSRCNCSFFPGSGSFCSDNQVICQPCNLRLKSSSPPPFPPPTNSTQSSGGTSSSKKGRLVFIVLGSVGLGLGISAAIGFVVFKHCTKRSNGRVHDTLGMGSMRPTPRVGPILDGRLGPFVEEFSMEALLRATDDFAESHKIGSGSFGLVYRATLADGRVVAIKRAHLASSSSRTIHKRRVQERAFLSELAVLSRVNHKNLVRLFGYCQEHGEKVLVYELMANGTLHDHLHKLKNSPLNSWKARLKVALDAARGIEYLHRYAVPAIIHRDIKSSNILLDVEWTAKVADFGLSLTSPGDEISAAGTVGYMDPEYYRLQRLTAKSDVYSFGVVLLELVTGCKAIHRSGEGSDSPRNVVEMAVPWIEADEVDRVLDRRIAPPTPAEVEAVAYVGYVAAECVRPEGRERPEMSEVVAALERAVAACWVAGLDRSETQRSR